MLQRAADLATDAFLSDSMQKINLTFMQRPRLGRYRPTEAQYTALILLPARLKSSIFKSQAIKMVCHGQ
jgi:hypothetical protein